MKKNDIANIIICICIFICVFILFASTIPHNNKEVVTDKIEQDGNYVLEINNNEYIDAPLSIYLELEIDDTYRETNIAVHYTFVSVIAFIITATYLLILTALNPIKLIFNAGDEK